MFSFVRFEVFRALRNVKYLLFLVVTPVGLYLIYGRTSDSALAMVAMTVYAATAGGLIGSGGGVAEDRMRGWLRQLKVTPLADRHWLAGKIVQGVLMIVPGVAGVTIAAVTTGHVHLSAGRWAALLALLLLGSLPFALLGLSLGLTLKGKSAQIGIVVVFFALAALGGLIGSGTMPYALEQVRHYLPTYNLAQAGFAIVGGHGPAATGLAVLGAWALVAGAAALALWRRESHAR
ncbi:ABC transporter permease [Nonomuraea rhodomycinica]|uniref:ABC transporter permease n=1 Tax=Nonomuraea rhodomycinica TaxID=1712872 RepID=A0A7Y6MD37_9ACTN|nr:ABC transporter permease [Nonomuraea rhodomycinica]NUW44043.1 ABC transporter permease [Nonomuraea rhodomycinica]